MNPCLKTAAAAAATLCLSASAWAQAGNVSVYGLVDVSAGQFQNAGAEKVTRLDSGDMATSFIGFKGKEDLGGGLKAIFALESFFLADSGAYGRFGGDVFWARAAWVGLEGSFGSTTLGRTTNQYFVSTLIFNAFSDSFGYSPSIRQFLTPSTGLPFYGDTGWSNSVLYSSPNFGGFSFNLQGAFGEHTANANITNFGNNIGANALYFAGPFAATVAYQKVKTDVPTGAIPLGFESQESYQLGLSYDAGFAKFFGQVAETKTNATTETKTTLYGIGASVPVGAGKILAQFGNADADFGGLSADVTNKTLTLGYDYFLSKRTDIYAVYMNDQMSGLSDGNTIAIGLRTTF